MLATGCVKPLARCPTSRRAAFLSCRQHGTAQTMEMVRIAG